MSNWMYVCPDCGCGDITVESVRAYWSPKNQTWEYDLDFDSVYCSACGDVSSGVEVEEWAENFDRQVPVGTMVRVKDDVDRYSQLYDQTLTTHPHIRTGIVIDPMTLKDTSPSISSFDYMLHHTTWVRLVNGALLQTWGRFLEEIDA